MNKLLIILLFIGGFLHAETKDAYLNIISNVQNTTIILDGKKIGKTPIKQYKVIPIKPLYLEAIVDKNYYRRDIKTTLKVNNKTIPTFSLKFQKAKSKIFFVGDDAELYINEKFIKKLHETNRVVWVDADEKVKIRLKNGYSDIVLIKDIKAKTVNTIKYKLNTIPKDVRLYTTSIDNLMWEDTVEATNTNITWAKALLYCDNLEIAHYKDFRLPTIKELSELYENKDKIYNGHGGKFYWSNSTFSDEFKVWNYSVVKNFEDGMNQKSIKEFEQGRVRCVRDIKSKKDKELDEDK